MERAMKAPKSSPDAPQGDALTGLATREAALARLGEWCAANERIHGALIGFRRFDAHNLAYGNAAGDAALVEVAQRMRHFAAAELEGGWLIARDGGSRFLLIAAEPCSREAWQLMVGQLLEALARPIATAAGTLRLSPRAALLRATFADKPVNVLDRLGQTLAGAMDQPARRLTWADGEATRLPVSAVQLEADLIQALDRGEIEVVFQPQFASADNRLTGAEALARWNHPKLGRLGAGALFTIAERADHVAQLSAHIARLALLAAQKWPMDLRLSLNVTPADLAAAEYDRMLAALIKQCRFAPWRLTLEVTEQVLLGDITHAAKVLGQLSGQGIQIALDDFGAGFCNFRYLQLLPLHYLKLDRAMIDGAVGNPRDLAVLRAIVAMARALDLKVIAEGVESEAQRHLIAGEGCNHYQGFLRAQPMDAAAFAEFALAN